MNESMGTGFMFSKPVILTIFYDVEELLATNSKTVNKDVTKEDIDPVILLWDTKNKSWYDTSSTVSVMKCQWFFHYIFNPQTEIIYYLNLICYV